MAKQKYRLQVLLVIRQRMKRKAEAALARAIKELIDAKKKLEKLEEEKKKITLRQKEMHLEMSQKMAASVAHVGEGNVYVNYLRKLKEDLEAKEEEIEEQKEVIREKEEAVALARREYIDAAKECKVMEKHKELWEKKQRDELSRKEQHEMDELGTTIHQLRRWRGEHAAME